MPFVNEPVPSEFIASFDVRRLRGEGGLGSVPDNPLFRWSLWTIDRERDAALFVVDDNDMTRREIDDTLPRRTWYALLWKGRVISFETTTGAYRIGGIAPGTEREYQVDVWFDTDIWLDDDLIEQLPEVLELTKEAYYVWFEGPDLPWIKGVEIRIRSVNDGRIMSGPQFTPNATQQQLIDLLKQQRAAKVTASPERFARFMSEFLQHLQRSCR